MEGASETVMKQLVQSHVMSKEWVNREYNMQTGFLPPNYTLISCRRLRVPRLPRPRRTAGQSLRDARERLLEDGLIPCVFGPAILWMIFITQLFYAMANRSPQPLLWLAEIPADLRPGHFAPRVLRHFLKPLNSGASDLCRAYL